jgi:hypothetical protein
MARTVVQGVAHSREPLGTVSAARSALPCIASSLPVRPEVPPVNFFGGATLRSTGWTNSLRQ